MKNWECRIRYEEGFPSFLRELIEWDLLEGSALGIAKQVLAQGVDSLSAKQLYVFENHIIAARTVEECTRCAHDIPWHEMVAAYRNGGYCDYCEHMRTRALEQD